MKIYLASPFFTDEHIEPLEYAEKTLRERGFELFSPREHEPRESFEVGTSQWSKAIFEMDREAIHDCDCMVMMFHGLYSDSGTAWECGYAYAINKPVVVVHLGDESNLMVHEGSHTNIRLGDLATFDFETMPVIPYSGKMK